MQKRKIGPVTGATTVGGALGASIAQIIIHFVPSLQPLESAVTVIITVILAVTAGWLVPPQAPTVLHAGLDVDSSDIIGQTESTGDDLDDPINDDETDPDGHVPGHEATVRRGPSALGVDTEEEKEFLGTW
ncbi:hypothetical protein [Auritidibacter sp. NML100628]|uniref:hypothetical protein n=1 Tax=Auritidibacter sp. NML100628 TaxID=2170742 RepID=UPI000D7342B8|nr:hypothetical protein [Auritidibacter sp. NML100628]PXA76484.1 hypothetical protein DCC24_06825 [Auritidibacter sp. NML100628]